MKNISCNCRCIFDGRKCNSSQKCKPTKIPTKYEKSKNNKILCMLKRLRAESYYMYL